MMSDRVAQRHPRRGGRARERRPRGSCSPPVPSTGGRVRNRIETRATDPSATPSTSTELKGRLDAQAAPGRPLQPGARIHDDRPALLRF